MKLINSSKNKLNSKISWFFKLSQTHTKSWRRAQSSYLIPQHVGLEMRRKVMQRGRVEAESVTHNYYNSSTKPKFYKSTRLAGKIIEKTSLTNFY